MAQRIILVDDFDGTDATNTVTFGFDGNNYEIDLNDTHTKDLAEALRPFMDRARPAKKGSARKRTSATTTQYPSSNPSRAERERNKQMREWGRANGYNVPERGKIPEDVRVAFEAATV